MSFQPINKVEDQHYYALGQPSLFRVTIINQDTKEVLYDQESKAGIVCSVESFEVLKETEEIEGNQQHFIWGPPAVTVHAVMQLKDYIGRLLKDTVFADAVRGMFKQNHIHKTKLAKVKKVTYNKNINIIRADTYAI